MRSPVRALLVSAVTAVVAMTILAGSVEAQDKYPSRPIEFIVPWGPGGGADQLARKLGQLLEPDLKVSLPVINVAGATGLTGHAKLLSANADGYTLEVMTGDTFAAAAEPNSTLKLADFIPLGVMIQQASGFFVAENAPYKTWADVEAAARAKPLKVAITGFNSPDDLTVSYYAAKGLKLQPVPYAKPGERYTSIIGNHADLLYEQAGDVRTFVDSKQIRPVLFFYGSKVEPFDAIPTSTSLGDKVTLPQFRIVLVKAGTDPAKVKLLADAIAKAAQTADFKTYLKDQYADPNSFVPAERATAYMDKWLGEARALVASIPKK
ncbi:MAG TPA: tripartite tricarboxylate transporter substrate binding protein [Casimicrobiaceae bacterium]|jgi:tripartite-type tricarboxylate transporter receptor subunit TctC|nr:tripartite tricarboxylate transporter substrate binding protein [Casimicrobiaceae bacterium]